MVAAAGTFSWATTTLEDMGGHAMLRSGGMGVEQGGGEGGEGGGFM